MPLRFGNSKLSAQRCYQHILCPELHFCSCYLQIPSHTITYSVQKSIFEEKSVRQNSIFEVLPSNNFKYHNKLCPELHFRREKRYPDEKTLSRTALLKRKALHWGDNSVGSQSLAQAKAILASGVISFNSIVEEKSLTVGRQLCQLSW